MKHLYRLLPILLFLLVTACSEKRKTDFSEYISAYTGGVVRSASTVRIFLNCNVKEGFSPESGLPSSLLEIRPRTEGRLYMRDRQTLEFVPDKPLENGRKYEVSFDLGACCDVPEQYREFRFAFETLPLDIRFEGEGLSVEEEDKDALVYTGLLYSSDHIADDRVEAMVSARFRGRMLPPEWEHEGDIHRFRIRHLAKGEEREELELKFSREVSNGSRTRIAVWGIREFRLLEASASPGDQSVLQVRMSEDVNPDQDLRGLVSIAGYRLENFSTTGNLIRIYLPSPAEDKELELCLHKGLSAVSGNRLDRDIRTSLRTETAKPEVRFIGKGVIVPDRDRTPVPFSTIGLKAVDLEVIQVQSRNMHLFFQDNSYEDNNQLIRTGRPVFRKRIDLLQERPGMDLDKWNDFTVDLSGLIRPERGNVYRIRLKFKRSYTTLPDLEGLPDTEYGTTDWDNASGYEYAGEYSYTEGYEWSQKDNPRHVSYYNGSHFAARNVISTSLGLLAKKGADSCYTVYVTDLTTAAPVSGCQVTLYNYQHQKIGNAVTDAEGHASPRAAGRAFVLCARKDEDKAWLKLTGPQALSLSNFDVSGQKVQMGVKGFVYGERGVWKPGDDIHLSLIVEDRLGMIPTGHPVLAELTDPDGRTAAAGKSEFKGEGIYCFHFKTSGEARSGYWHATFRIGSITFRKTVRIEHVRPNRLDIRLEVPDGRILGWGAGKGPVQVRSSWLHGGKAAGRKAGAEVRLYAGRKGFDRYPDYCFTDAARKFDPTGIRLFDGHTDASGCFSIPLDSLAGVQAPGMLDAVFTTKVYENSGDYSISSRSLPYSPYSRYVGLRLPSSSSGWFPVSAPLHVDGVCVDPEGRKCGEDEVTLEVYRLEWHWWWDAAEENLGLYVNRKFNRCILEKKVRARNGSFHSDLEIKENGRYYIRATHPSGHSGSLIAYMGSWEDSTTPETATMLQLSTDRKSYRVGDTVCLSIPSPVGATAVISLENGRNVISSRRLQTTPGTTVYRFKAGRDMCPNAYLSATLIQSCGDKDNDRPVRMYGVTGIDVEDPDLLLHPEIGMADTLRPGREFTVEIREKDGKEMQYTLAVVDEGLLSLTSFPRPDPFGAFYAREALGVQTWDFYDHIYGAYGARLEKAFAIGGDEALQERRDVTANRFEPVVLFKGPFTLKAGESRKHRFTMPAYIGEVRTTVVAARSGRYGAADRRSRVSQPLMLYLSLPGSIAPGDEVDIPVTVFAREGRPVKASLELQAGRGITLLEGNSRDILFQGRQEVTVHFKVRADRNCGPVSIRVTAACGKERAEASARTEIRLPNPRICRMEAADLPAGGQKTFHSTITGADPSAVLEISSIPQLNLEANLQALESQDYGWAGERIAAAMSSMALPDLTGTGAREKAVLQEKVSGTINGLNGYQTADGGFSCWPRGRKSDGWITVHAVRFLTSAREKGYTVPRMMLAAALRYLHRAANGSVPDKPGERLMQAYRLYVLALAGEADIAAMNRLKEDLPAHPAGQWLLAASYTLCQYPQIAGKMVRNLPSVPHPCRTDAFPGSSLMEQALTLECMTLTGLQQPALRMLENVSRGLGSPALSNPLETAVALEAAAGFVRKYLGRQEGIHVLVREGKDETEISTARTVWQMPLEVRAGEAVCSLENTGKGNLFVRLVTSSVPYGPVGAVKGQGLEMKVRHLDADGKPIQPEQIRQGTGIITEVTVRNTGLTGTYRHLTLTCPLPSGCEAVNGRLHGEAVDADHTDIREDRFQVSFSLDQNREKCFRFMSHASFRGRYALPAISCSDLYDRSVQAVWPGGILRIVE